MKLSKQNDIGSLQRKMKLSRYNLFFSDHEGNCLIYNGLHNTLVRVDEEVKNLLKEIKLGKECSPPKKVLKTLEKKGIIVPGKINEKKIFKVFHAQEKYNPRKIFFSITPSFKCNVDCEYCYQKSLRESKNEPITPMNGETVNKTMDFIKNMAIDTDCDEIIILWYGGEPLLNTKIIIKILDGLSLWLEESGIKLKNHIWTNGTLLTEKILNKLLKYDIVFQLTLTGPQEIHDSKMHWGEKSTFQRIIKALKLLQSKGAKFLIRVNVDKDNFCFMEKLLEDLKERVGRGLNISFYSMLPCVEPFFESYTYDQSCLSVEEKGKIPKLWKLASKKGFNVVFPPLSRCVGCIHSRAYSFVIDPLGDLYKCITEVSYEKRKNYKIGTIGNNGRLQITDNENFYNWMNNDPLQVSPCKDCPFLPVCGGLCFVVQRDYSEISPDYSCPNKTIVYSQVKFQISQRFPQYFQGSTP